MLTVPSLSVEGAVITDRTHNHSASTSPSALARSPLTVQNILLTSASSRDILSNAMETRASSVFAISLPDARQPVNDRITHSTRPRSPPRAVSATYSSQSRGARMLQSTSTCPVPAVNDACSPFISSTCACATRSTLKSSSPAPRSFSNYEP